MNTSAFSSSLRIKNLLNTPIIGIKNDQYLMLLMILAPLLNFLSGITFDLHAASLPAIAIYYAAPISAAKNTITFSLLGFAVGCIFFGTLLDIYGRRPVILLGLFIYTLASFLALVCSTINELLLIRLLQGFTVSCLSIGCRTMVLDNFTGHRFKVALLYTSLAFGIGPILAPFIGGFLQYHFGWKANFIAYGIVSFTLMVIVVLFATESIKNRALFSFKMMYLNYLDVLRHKSFTPGAIISGISQVQLLIYTTTGAFLIENILHRTAITYGNSALVISCGYLLGTLTNRFLIKRFSLYHLISLGFVLLFFGIAMQMLFSIFSQLSLMTIILPITLIGFSNGFIFINVFACCLRSSNNAGTATALFTSAVMIMGTLGTGIISHINVNNLVGLTTLFGISGVIQLFTFVFFFKDTAKEAF